MDIIYNSDGYIILPSKTLKKPKIKTPKVTMIQVLKRDPIHVDHDLNNIKTLHNLHTN